LRCRRESDFALQALVEGCAAKTERVRLGLLVAATLLSESL